MAKTSSKKTPSKKANPANTIAFQGFLGANSHIACMECFPKMAVLPCVRFEEAFEAVENGKARLAMIPVDNSIAGRVADIHHILPNAGLSIIGEHFMRITYQLMAVPGASLKTLKRVESHVQSLSQCAKFVRKHKLTPIVSADNAGAAKDVAERGDKTVAAIAPPLAAKIYGLKTLASNIEDADHNTTRFLIMAKTPLKSNPKNGPFVTSFVFRVRNVPAALYKAMGGFATNSVNMTKLESYMVGGHFTATQFYAEVDGHPSQRALQLAFEELRFYSKEVTILGTYRGHPYRYQTVPAELAISRRPSRR